MSVWLYLHFGRYTIGMPFLCKNNVNFCNNISNHVKVLKKNADNVEEDS